MEASVFQRNACLNCGLTGSKVKTCASCNIANYCSKSCQRTDWAAHHSLEHTQEARRLRHAIGKRYKLLHRKMRHDPSSFIDRVTVMPRLVEPDILKPQQKAKPRPSEQANPAWQKARKTQEAMGKEWLREGKALGKEGRDFVVNMRQAMRRTLSDEAQAKFDEMVGRYDATYNKFVREMHSQGRSMTSVMQELQSIAAEINLLFTQQTQQPDPEGFNDFVNSIVADSATHAKCEEDATQQQQRDEAELERLMTEVEQELGMPVGAGPLDTGNEDAMVQAEAQRNGVRYSSEDGFVTEVLPRGEIRRVPVEQAQQEHDERAKAMNDRAVREAFAAHVQFRGAEQSLQSRVTPSIAGKDGPEEQRTWRQRWQDSEEVLRQRQTRNERVRARSPRRGRIRNTNERDEQLVSATRSEFNIGTGEWEERESVGIQERTTKLVEDILGPTLGEDIADQTVSGLNEFWGAVNQATASEWIALVVSTGILTGIIGRTVLPWAATGDWVQDQTWINSVNRTSTSIMTRALERHGQQAKDISMHTWRAVFEEHGLAFHAADTNALSEESFRSALTTFSTDSAELVSSMEPNLQRLMNESQQTLQTFFTTVWDNLVHNNRLGLNDEEMASAVGHLHSMAMEMWRKAMAAGTPAQMESQLKICSSVVNAMMEGGTEALFRITNEGVGLSDPRGTLEAVGDMINGSVAFNDISLRALMASQTDEEVRRSIQIPFETIRMAAEPGRRAAESLPYSAGIAATVVAQYPATPIVGRVAFLLLDIGSGITRLEWSYQQLQQLMGMSVAQDGLASYFGVLGSVGWAMFNLFTFFPIIAYSAEGMEQLFGWLENASETVAAFFGEFAEKVAKWGSNSNMLNKLFVSPLARGLLKMAQGLFKVAQGLGWVVRHVGHFLKKVLEATHAGTAKARAASVALMSSYFFIQFMIFSAQLGWAFVVWFAPPMGPIYTGVLWESLGSSVAQAVDSYEPSPGAAETFGAWAGFSMGWGTYLMLALFRNQAHFLYSWPSYQIKAALSSVRYAISKPERMQSTILWTRMFALGAGLYLTYRGSGQVETTFSADLDIKAQPNLWYMNDQTLFQDTTDSYRMLNHITNSSGLLSAMKAAEGAPVDESLVREWWLRTFSVNSFEQFISHGTVTYDHRITFEELTENLNQYWRNVTGLESLFNVSAT